MNLKRNINKKGSYIVEAATTLPVFIVAVTVMMSIILMYSYIENANFILANKMRSEMIATEVTGQDLAFWLRAESEIKRSNEHINKLTITDYMYRGVLGDLDEIIAVRYRMDMKINNPLKIASEASCDISLMSRAYVGKEKALDPMTEEEFGNGDTVAVFVFPKSGERYHKENCTFVKAGSYSLPLSAEVKSTYSPCPICKSKGSSEGSLVHIFPEYGESYHLGNCPVLERNFIELDKKTAIKRGYLPCSKCGGE